MRSVDELREPGSFFADLSDAAPDAEAVSLASDLMRRNAGPFRPEDFPDEYQAALRELIDAKLEHRAPEVAVIPDQPTGSVINIMDALKESMKRNVGAAKARGRESKRRTAPKPERVVAAARGSKRSPKGGVHGRQ